MSRAEADAFWQFSLAFYGRPLVQEACLALQDEAGLNVNLVLWCCWHAANGRALTEADADGAMARLAAWSEGVTRPLRALRRKVKAGPDIPLEGDARGRLYERLKAAELEAERVEQTLLSTGALPTGPESQRLSPAHLVKQNLRAYMETAGAPGGGRFRTVLPERLAHELDAVRARSVFG